MPTFDIASAIKEGHNPADIADYLGADMGFDTNAARDSGHSDLDILGYLTKREVTEEMIESMSGTEKFLAGVGKGYTDVPAGIKQIGLQVGEEVGLLPPDTAGEYTRQLYAEEREYDQPLLETTPGAVGRIVGQTAATAPLGAGFRGATIPMRMGQAAIESGVSESLLPVPEGVSRLEQGGRAAVAGGVMSGGLEAAGVGYRKLRGGDSARYTQEVSDVAKIEKIPLTVGELRNSPTLKKFESILDEIPIIGTVGFRNKQGKAVFKSAQALKMKYGVDITDAGEEIQTQLMLARKASKAEAQDLYDEVGDLAAQVEGKVVPTNTRNMAADFISEESLLPKAFQDPETVELLNKYVNLEDVSFDVVRKLRSRIGKASRQAEKQAITGNVSDEYVASLKRLQGALESDIQGFAEKQGGELYDKYRVAQDFYRENVAPFADREIRRLGTTDFDTDTIVNMFIKADRPKKALKLINKLDDSGKDAVRYAIIEKLFDNAYDATSEVFSPAKFAGGIDRLGKTVQAVFGSEGASYLEGYAKLMRAAEKAGQYTARPLTGNRIVQAGVPVAAGVGYQLDPIYTAGIIGSTAMFSKLMTTEVGRKLLTRVNGIKDPNKAQKIVSRLFEREIPRAISLADAQEEKHKKLQIKRKQYARGER